MVVLIYRKIDAMNCGLCGSVRLLEHEMEIVKNISLVYHKKVSKQSIGVIGGIVVLRRS